MGGKRKLIFSEDEEISKKDMRRIKDRDAKREKRAQEACEQSRNPFKKNHVNVETGCLSIGTLLQRDSNIQINRGCDGKPHKQPMHKQPIVVR